MIRLHTFSPWAPSPNGVETYLLLYILNLVPGQVSVKEAGYVAERFRNMLQYE